MCILGSLKSWSTPAVWGVLRSAPPSSRGSVGFLVSQNSGEQKGDMPQGERLFFPFLPQQNEWRSESQIPAQHWLPSKRHFLWNGICLHKRATQPRVFLQLWRQLSERCHCWAMIEEERGEKLLRSTRHLLERDQQGAGWVSLRSCPGGDTGRPLQVTASSTPVAAGSVCCVSVSGHFLLTLWEVLEVQMSLANCIDFKESKTQCSLSSGLISGHGLNKSQHWVLAPNLACKLAFINHKGINRMEGFLFSEIFFWQSPFRDQVFSCSTEQTRAARWYFLCYVVICHNREAVEMLGGQSSNGQPSLFCPGHNVCFTFARNRFANIFTSSVSFSLL